MRYILPSLLARYINSSYLFSMASWGKYALYTAFFAWLGTSTCRTCFLWRPGGNMRYILPSLLARYINSSYLFSMASWGKHALYTAFVAWLGTLTRRNCFLWRPGGNVRYILPSLLARYINSSYLFSMAYGGKYALYTAFFAWLGTSTCRTCFLWRPGGNMRYILPSLPG